MTILVAQSLALQRLRSLRYMLVKLDNPTSSNHCQLDRH